MNGHIETPPPGKSGFLVFIEGVYQDDADTLDGAMDIMSDFGAICTEVTEGEAP